MAENLDLEKENKQAELSSKKDGVEQAEPSLDVANEPVKKELGKGSKLLLAIGLAILVFLGGAFSTWLCLDPEIRTLIKVKHKIQTEYYGGVADEEFYSVIFDAINNDLLDAYSQYMTEEEFAAAKTSAQGNRSGLGLSFTAADAQILRISRVSGNSPAENAGIVAGSYILGGGESPETIADFANYNAFSNFLSGYEAGQTIYVKLRVGNAEKTVAIAKAAYVENYVYYRTSENAYRFTGENATDMTEGGVPLSCLPADGAYIRLTSFNGGAATQFAKSMQKFREEGKKTLVLDLRGNGGGYMHILQDIAKYFCKNSNEQKPLVSVADYNNHKENFLASGNVYNEYFSSNSRICVLADCNTASASECLLGALMDYQAISYADICLSERGGVAKTYGKGIMQTTFTLPFGQDAIKLTTARVLWPVSGNCIHGVGVLPENGALSVPENSDEDLEIASAIEKLGI